MILKWSNEFSIGNNLIDSQHKKLFMLVNSLTRLNEKNSTAADMTRTLDFILKYAVRHFKDEEALQAMYDYPDYNAHKKTHDDFTQTAIMLRDEHNKSFSYEKFKNLKNILHDWVKQHVMVDDKKIGEFIKGRVPTFSKWLSTNSKDVFRSFLYTTKTISSVP